MIRTILHMRVQPGREGEFERRFAQLDVLGAAARAAGLRSGELLRPASNGAGLRPRGGGSYVVTATWDGPEAYQRWRDSAAREEIGTALDGLVTPSPEPEMFEVLAVHPPAQGRGV